MFGLGGLPVWLLWYQVGSVVVTLLAVVFWVYWKKVRIYFEAEFWRKSSEGGEYEWVGSKEFKRHDKVVKFKSHSFFIDIKRKLGRTKNKLIVAFDFDTGDYLNFGGKFLGGSVAYHDEMLSSGVFGRIIRTITSMDAYTLIVIGTLIAGMVLTFVLGLFVSPYLLPVVNASGGV